MDFKLQEFCASPPIPREATTLAFLKLGGGVELLLSYRKQKQQHSIILLFLFLYRRFYRAMKSFGSFQKLITIFIIKQPFQAHQ
jgi:hypothetical protein